MNEDVYKWITGVVLVIFEVPLLPVPVAIPTTTYVQQQWKQREEEEEEEMERHELAQLSRRRRQDWRRQRNDDGIGGAAIRLLELTSFDPLKRPTKSPTLSLLI
eukprot:GHVU01023250.1.p2 GENE.GHVU01023250.1~~GHVU01023250.1.p2  ORF type:complete len:104 (+),score=22.60 GHVU01023250.1:149-460(+)